MVKKVEHKNIQKRMCSLVLFEDKNNLDEIIELVKKLTNDLWVESYAMIIHDKDVYTKADQAEDEEKPEDKRKGIIAGNQKPRHLHVGLKFYTPKKFGAVANKFNVPVELVQGISSGSFARYMLYLTHETNEAIKQGKHQYKDNEVISNIDNWSDMKNADKAKQRAVSQEDMIDWYLEQAIDGEITKTDLGDKLPELIYIKKKTQFDNAFELAKEKEIKQMLENEEYHTTVIYICGGSGTGKTTLAKRISKELTSGLPYVSGTGGDLFGGYKGEKAVILDDVRPNTLEYNEWLKLLDPNTMSETHARYKNKLITAPVIIITNCLSLNEFVKNIERTVEEDDKQFKRRVKTIIEINLHEYVVKEYQEKENDYREISRHENDLKERIEKSEIKKITTQDIVNILKN